MFNAVINSLDLREIALSGRNFTWANNLTIPTFEKLDRVLVSTDWEEKFPLVTVSALERFPSDHTPLLLNTGATTHNRQPPLFKFDLAWLQRDGFVDMVSEVWNE